MHFAEFLEHIQAGHLSTVKEAIQVNPSLVHARDERDGVTALHWAAEYSQVEIAKWLVSHGADVHARDDEQATPLFPAVFNSLDIALLLLDAGRLRIHGHQMLVRTDNASVAYGRVATANRGRIKSRLVFQELVRPSREDVAFVIDGQGAALGVQGGFHILPLETATHFETESQHMQVAIR